MSHIWGIGKFGGVPLSAGNGTIRPEYISWFKENVDSIGMPRFRTRHETPAQIISRHLYEEEDIGRRHIPQKVDWEDPQSFGKKHLYFGINLLL